MLLRLFLLLFVLLLRGFAQALSDVGGPTVRLGETVILPCESPSTDDELTQITWQRRTKLKPLNDNFFIIEEDSSRYINGGDNRFTFVGDFSKKDGRLRFSNVTLMDEGTYTCIISLFPSGNQKIEVPLRVLVPPSISLKETPFILGDEESLIANCTAAGSKPPVEVQWNIDNVGQELRVVNISTQHEDGTTTTVSSLYGKPTKELNDVEVQCVVTGEALVKKQELSFKIQVHFPPSEVIISKVSEKLFECKSEANPIANITWSRFSPVENIPGALLQISSLSSDVNNIFRCEASNPYGSKEAFFYVHVPPREHCWVYLFLVFLLAVCVLAVWKCCQLEKCQRLMETLTGLLQKGPANNGQV